ncbi:hairy-related 3 [Nerophis lumbriciformis]|uniref:hairy-related 3 n=1 Tax=Nerophis lumbriciformis TaxID=546530 RepID=UPI002ADF7E84|nr:transcription factor HES-3-like [Nerophis lumbriciformis]
MVATTDCMDKSITANRVSKPLMEKKRRARINKCLDQLKCLLESHYSSSIRKRKLEKADILELTVRHVKHLQKTQTYFCRRGELSDYQKGFQSCLANFNHHLLTADKNVTDRNRLKLAQLRAKLCVGGAPQDKISTMDSGLVGQLARRAEEDESSLAVRGRDSEHTRGSKQCGLVTTTSSKDTRGKSATQQKSTRPREVGATQDKVWRPW